MKLTELKQREPQHLCVYGDSKTGKSTLVSELALFGFDIIWISVDGGHRVLYKLPQEAQEKIDVIVIPDTRAYPNAINVVRDLLSGKPTNLCHAHSHKDCSLCKKDSPEKFTLYEFSKLPLTTIVVIDHMTGVSDSCIFNVTKGKPIDYKLQLDDWGALRFFMTDILKTMQAAPFNLVAICQSEEVQLEDKSMRLAPSIGSRNFGRTVGQFFDHVIYCEVFSMGHHFGSNTGYKPVALTGSRSDVNIEKMQKPSLLPFFDGSIPSLKDSDKEKAKVILTTIATGLKR